MSKGSIGIEFVVATALFLAAFWFIYFQSALMLTPQLQRNDVRELAVEFYSGQLISDPGIPADWSSFPNHTGLAVYSGGSTKVGVLNWTKVKWAATQNCAGLNTSMAGMEFAWRVSTSAGTRACTTSIPEQGVVKRPVFVLVGKSYRPGKIEVWAA